MLDCVTITVPRPKVSEGCIAENATILDCDQDWKSAHLARFEPAPAAVEIVEGVEPHGGRVYDYFIEDLEDSRQVIDASIAYFHFLPRSL
jgi:hypothetical protein